MPDDFNHIHFLPWKGDRYNENRCRLVILGESHHGQPGDNDRQFTRQVTEDYVNGWNHRFWSQLGQAVTGKPHWDIDRREFWNSVAFYNYVQVIAAAGPGRSPTEQMFSQSEPAFWEMLDTLKPSHLIACGYRLWRHMPALGDENLTIVCNGTSHPFGYYPRPWGSTAAMVIKHPSWGFSAPYWHPAIRQFLALNAPDASGADLRPELSPLDIRLNRSR